MPLPLPCLSLIHICNKNRNQNSRLAADAVDGLVVNPGEEFSFNRATGNRTSDKGYQPAGAYRNGVLIEEPGGGVCQVSTTLYHAIIQSGFKTCLLYTSGVYHVSGSFRTQL